MFINNFKKSKLLFTLSLLVFFNIIQAQQESNLIEISGRVASQDTKEPLPNVSVTIKGTVAGTITNNEGQFKLRTKLKFPLKLIFLR